jgi:uncharacterized membrane protein YjjP (DUF1212 family)
MTPQGVSGSTPGVVDEYAEAIDFLVQLGASLIRTGSAVTDVQDRLQLVAARLGLDDTDIVVLPTAVLIQSRTGSLKQSRLSSFRRSWLRLDQIGDIDELARRAERGEVPVREGLERLALIASAPPTHRALVRVLGMGVLSAGFALLLQPTPAGVALALVLGLLVGVLRVVELPRLEAVLPVLATFAVSAVVFEFTARYEIDNPIRMLIPPLVLFLPGAALTTGTMELAAGDTVSGASRLVEGVVTLLLLAFGILIAAQLAGVPDSELLDDPTGRLGWIAPIVGLVVITLGHYLHNCAPLGATGWILLVTGVAFGGQAAGAALVSPELSGFFGAIVMTPLILSLSRRPAGPPEMTMFLPAFWVLVPGATGLIGVTEAVGVTGVAASDFTETAVTVASITLGILLGAAMWNASNEAASYARGLIGDLRSDRSP